MEATTVQAPRDELKDQVTAAEEETRATEAAAEVTVAQMFQYSRWLHVGPGAEECEAVDEAEGTCSCSNPLHFHAWMRLPNKFQHRDIRKKALAAKSLAEMQLTDPTTDAARVLEADMRFLREQGDVATMIDDILAPMFAKHYIEAVGELQEDERWEHIDAHREQYNRIVEAELGKPEEDRTDEFKTLHKHITAFQDALKARVEEIQAPERKGYEEMEKDKLVELIRDKRIEREADSEYGQVYAEWSIYVGTFTQKGNAVTAAARKFASIEHMKDTAPEVVDALEEAFTELQIALGRAVQGNS